MSALRLRAPASKVHRLLGIKLGLNTALRDQSLRFVVDLKLASSLVPRCAKVARDHRVARRVDVDDVSTLVVASRGDMFPIRRHIQEELVI